jgi:hypothetical protein
MEHSPMRLRSLLVGSLAAALMVAGAPVEAGQPARVLLRSLTSSDGRVQLTATVLDGSGAPVADVPVTFRTRTAFGWLTLAETATGQDGTAAVSVPPSPLAREVRVEAGEEGTLRATVSLGAPRASPPRIRPGRTLLRALSPQPGFTSPYPVPAQVLLVGGVLAGIWSTYGYVIWLLLRIRREGTPR